MKTTTRISLHTSLILALAALLTSSSHAAIVPTDDVVPADPVTWDDTTNGYIGKNGPGALGITSGGTVSSSYGYIGYNSGSTGAVSVDGTGSAWASSNGLYVGYDGNGTLDITSGGTVSNHYLGRIGNNSGSTGAVTVDGTDSTWNGGWDLHVGCNGDGTLDITSGGTVRSVFGHIGHASGSTGSVTVDGTGSMWATYDDLYVGVGGDGTLEITSGGTVSNTHGYIGRSSGSTGAVTVAGTDSMWSGNVVLDVGRSGAGTLEITSGGRVGSYFGYIGRNSGSTGAVTVEGTDSTWNSYDDLVVGRYGNGTLEITSGGLVRVAGLLTIDDDRDGDGFINMATGGMLALSGGAVDDSLDDLLGRVSGTDAIRYWDGSAWAAITGAIENVDYTLDYQATGDLAGYSVLTVGVVPEPSSISLLCLGAFTLLSVGRFRRR